jgi:AraC-like DNA-binding protein
MDRIFVTPDFAHLPRRKLVLLPNRTLEAHHCSVSALGLTIKRNVDLFRSSMFGRTSEVGIRYVTGGEGRLRLESAGDEWPVKPGAVMLVMKEQPASWWTPPGMEWEVLWINLVGDAARHHARRIMAQHGPLFRLPPTSGLVYNMLHLYREALSGNLPDEYMLSAAAYQMLMQIRSSRRTAPAELTEVPELVENARRQLQERLADPAFDVAALARGLGCSRAHLARLFKRHLGTGPRAHLIHIRLSEGARLLVESDLTVKEIARRVGFSDASHLGKTMRKHTGLRPLEIRARRDGLELAQLIAEPTPAPASPSAELLE